MWFSSIDEFDIVPESLITLAYNHMVYLLSLPLLSKQIGLGNVLF